MRYRNTKRIPKYCLHARRTLQVAQTSAELPMLRMVLKDLYDTDKELDIILTDEEIKLMQSLLDRHVAALGFNLSDLDDVLADPDHSKSKALKAAAEKSEKMKEYHKRISENKEFEKMVRGETSEKKREAVRNAGSFDIMAMDVTLGQKPKNLREAMALNAKMDVIRKAKNENKDGTDGKGTGGSK